MSTHVARKRFGQNFLQDHNIIDQIVGNLNIQSGQHWLEIGPGQGALTQPLLQKVEKLDVIELDRDLVTLLQAKFYNQSHFTIHSADALRFDFTTLGSTIQRLHVVGNLPYNISTPLLFHLLQHAECIEAMYFMLQKEVVDRICASVNGKQYGRLSVMMQYYCDTEHLFDVPPESFYPIPKVMSAVVKLIPHQVKPLVANEQVLNKIVTQAFSQRRKTLRNALKTLVSEAILNELEIDPTLRPENV